MLNGELGESGKATKTLQEENEGGKYMKRMVT